MKNKEIEELLNNIKEQLIIDEKLGKEIVKRLKDSLDYEFDLSFNERKELLSYIEQLENNRDKAYEFVKEKRKAFEWYDTDLFYLESLLKGDTDE